MLTVKNFLRLKGIMAIILLGLAACSSQGAIIHNHSQAYVDEVTIGNMFEMQASRLAETHASSTDVKAFARMMTTDHALISGCLDAAMDESQLFLNLPTRLDAKHKAWIAELKEKQGADFDTAYTKIQTNAHKSAYSLHARYSQNGEVPALKKVAEEALPIIKNHLVMVKHLHELK